MNTLINMLSINLSSTNYLSWKSQILPVLSCQGLLGHVDDTSSLPPAEITQGDKSITNPDYIKWFANDQKAVMILNASLTEEAIAEVFGLQDSPSMWLALENAFCNMSIERVHLLRDQLRQSTKGSDTVSNYGRKFKLICDPFAAVGHPVDETEKIHSFICGLGASFKIFSTSIRTAQSPSKFWDLLVLAESQEMFQKHIHGSSTPAVAFRAETNRGSSNFRARGGRFSRGNISSRGRGRNRRSPHCQLCHNDGHYTNMCPNLATYARQANPSESDLAKAFLTQCNLNPANPDWTSDTGASDHMASSADNLQNATPYTRDANVTFGNDFY
ncbi:zinc finger, CCHC-type [Artemisia annua]|uniref:Zinc finger, CCHC-type n=1 Tax=Artemisia annua TaxID=35608 RepID=A0A2U1KWI5_ARTAN|nr:zinc finger, CCHC-type [Artemisia annua]